MRDEASPRAEGTTLSSGVVVRALPAITDPHGRLTFAQYNDHLPFAPQRFFLLYDITPGRERGHHAHRTCHQFFVCVRGSCSVVTTDGVSTDDIDLWQPTTGLYVPPMTWVVVRPGDGDPAVLVLASHAYDEADYIRDRQEFELARGGR